MTTQIITKSRGFSIRKYASLNKQDRCDRCRAEAWFLAVMPSGLELMFCAHHKVQHEDALFNQGAVVYERA